jgi:hypothetical protein
MLDVFFPSAGVARHLGICHLEDLQTLNLRVRHWCQVRNFQGWHGLLPFPPCGVWLEGSGARPGNVSSSGIRVLV